MHSLSGIYSSSLLHTCNSDIGLASMLDVSTCRGIQDQPNPMHAFWSPVTAQPGQPATDHAHGLARGPVWPTLNYAVTMPVGWGDTRILRNLISAIFMVLQNIQAINNIQQHFCQRDGLRQFKRELTERVVRGSKEHRSKRKHIKEK